MAKIQDKDYIDIPYNDFYLKKIFTDVGELNKITNITSLDLNNIKVEVNSPIRFNIGIIDDNYNNTIDINDWIPQGRKYSKKIIHNLNKKFPTVTIWNLDTNQIEIPANIISINSNSIKIELYQPANVKVNIVDTLLDKTNLTLNQLDWNYDGVFFKDVTHNFNKRFPTVTIWNTSTNEIHKLSNIESLDLNTIRIEVNKPINASIQIIDNIYENVVYPDDWDYKDYSYYKIINHNLNSKIWEFSHNLNTDNIIFTVYDLNHNIVYPERVEIDGFNMKIYFDEPTSGKCVVSKTDYNEYITDQSTWDIEHSLNTNNIIFSVYDNDDNIIYPKDIDITNNNLTLHFEDNVSGKCVIMRSGDNYNSITEKLVWDIEHAFDDHIIFSIYDINSEIIYPKDIEISNNNLKLYFEKPVNGKCIISSADMCSGYINRKSNQNYGFDRHPSVTTWNIKDLVLSCTYRIEFNLDTEPLTALEIEPKYLCDSLSYYYEIFRPVNRVFEKVFTITPFTDFSGEWFSLYDDIAYKNHCLTRYVMKETHTRDSWIHLQMYSSDTWTVDHGLNTDKVLVQALDLNMNQVIPKRVIYENNTIILKFDHEVSGACLLKKADWYKRNVNISENWLIKHEMDNQESLIQLRRLEEGTYSYSIKENILSDYWIPSDDYYYRDVIHNLNNKYPIVMVWNIDNKKIEVPSDIRTIDKNIIRIDSEKDINSEVILFSEPDESMNIDINNTDWIYNGDYYFKIINHNLNRNYLFVTMWNTDTNKIEKTAKLININSNSIGIYSAIPINAKINLSIPKNNVSITEWTLDEDEYYSDINYEMNDIYPIINTWNLNTNEVEKYINIECINNNTLRVWSTNSNPIRVNINLMLLDDTMRKEEIFEPSNIQLINEDEILTDGHISTALGTIPDYIIFFELEEKIIWNIEHGLNKRGIMAQFYDENNNLIYPKNYKIVNNNLIRAEFHYPEKGYAVLKDIGHYFLQNELLPDMYGNFDLTFKAGVNQDSMLKDGIMFTKDINTIYIIDNIYHIPISIPKGYDTYDIREMGIFEKSTNDLIVYTKCYPIYKHSDFEIEVTYKIHKDNIQN